jgi:exonuclease SbcC
VVNGRQGNRLSQPLSAFVVQSMFDEVLVSANRRLLSMLDGRFELVATEERVGRALGGQGLGLAVRDLRTDTQRKASTLSGGESFCASLALALGLAETVRANAGGIELGMLFIDEGFGSLDVDRLDDVMAELATLQADGRVVGLISHVTEMKQAIHERIDVTSLGPTSASTLTVSWA